MVKIIDKNITQCVYYRGLSSELLTGGTPALELRDHGARPGQGDAIFYVADFCLIVSNFRS